MRAIVYDSPRSFDVREVPTPEPASGEMRVSVIQSGLCGTDLHLHEGQFMASFPFTPGHEVVGRVDALGPGVTGRMGVTRDQPSRQRLLVRPGEGYGRSGQLLHRHGV